MTARVARIITRLNIGGPSIQAISLSRGLAAAGFETLLVHGRLGDAEGDMTVLMPLGDDKALYVDVLTRPVAPARDLQALWQIYWALRRWRPAIVHTHMAKAGAIGRLAAVAYNWTRGSAPRARLVHTYHGHVFDGYFGSPSARVFLAVERWLARRSDTLIAISPRVRLDIIETYRIATESRVRLIPLKFNLDRLLSIGPEERVAARAALDIPADRLVVSTVGRLTAIKEHALFIDAAALIVAQCDRALFLIVGDGELRSSLEAQVVARRLDRHIRFLGWRGDLGTIYGATDVFMLTSRNEGTPVALIEAMASAVASVSTDVGGVRDVITDASVGSLVASGDAQALAAAALGYLNDPDAGLAPAMRHDWRSLRGLTVVVSSMTSVPFMRSCSATRNSRAGPVRFARSLWLAMSGVAVQYWSDIRATSRRPRRRPAPGLTEAIGRAGLRTAGQAALLHMC